MQKEISIETSDGYKIYGSLTFSYEKSDKLVIFVHGFTSHKDEHIFFNGAKFFNENCYDSFRFDLYSSCEGARHFTETSISIHGKDINFVKNYFKDKYKDIYIIGHSYGGTSLLFADTENVNCFVFWDASYINKNYNPEDLVFNKDLNAYILKDRIDYIVSNKFVEELKNFPDCSLIISKINIPVKFITAGSLEGDDSGEKYFSSANQPKEIVNIEKADHNFNGFKEEELLFKETLSFLNKY